MNCVTDVFIRFAYKRSASSLAIFCVAAGSSGEARNWCVPASFSAGFEKEPLTLIASARSNTSMGFGSFFSVSGFEYAVQNEIFIALCRMHPGLAAIDVKFALLPVYRAAHIFLIRSILVLDIELIGGSSLGIEFLCLSGDF